VRQQREVFSVVAEGKSGHVDFYRLGLRIRQLFFGVCS
jgi:hypothetical protein